MQTQVMKFAFFLSRVLTFFLFLASMASNRAWEDLSNATGNCSVTDDYVRMGWTPLGLYLMVSIVAF